MAYPKFEEFQAPWEVKDGQPVAEADQVIDPKVLKKYLWNLGSDKDKAQTARDAALAQVTELTGKVTELETKVNDKGAENLSEIQKLQKSIDELSQRAADAELAKTRLEVMTKSNLKDEAGEFLTGKTLAELEASAAKLVGLGLVKEATTGGETKVDDQGNPIVTQPEVKHRVNPGDPNGGNNKELPSVEDFVKDYNSKHAGVFGG